MDPGSLCARSSYFLSHIDCFAEDLCVLPQTGGLASRGGVSILLFSGGRFPSLFSHRAQPLSPAHPLAGCSPVGSLCLGLSR